MNTKMSKRQRDLKAKLMAAIAMLLVSSIMMVSTTYAWFTLSTAPEVTGITTAVGANGNLEMALLPASDPFTAEKDFGITTGVGDGVIQDITLKNATWGNLVDLSGSTYGLDQITLYPAALNATAGRIQRATPLSYPEYGPDGRITKLNGNTLTAAYHTGSNFNPDSDYGVRAVGSASGMTERQQTFRVAKSNAGSYTTTAANMASKLLQNKGSSLGNIAIQYGIKKAEAKFTRADVEALKVIADGLNPVFDEIEKAYLQYMLAYAASTAGGDDAAYTVLKGYINGANNDLDAFLKVIYDNNRWNDLPAELKTGVEKLGYYFVPAAATEGETPAAQSVPGSKGLVSDALNGYMEGTTQRLGLTALLAEAKDEYTWNEIRPILVKLANPNEMTVLGYAPDELMDHAGEVAGNISNGLNIEIKKGAGVFADIAEQTDNYTATGVVIKDVSFGGMNLGDVPVNMTTKVDPPHYLNALGTVIGKLSAPASSTGEVAISDMYGYIIDMAFKTNAAGSKLVLQQTPVDRIYTGSTGAADENGMSTMGNGANMTFTSPNATFGADAMKALMDNIVIVFFNANTGDIIHYAKLYTEGVQPSASGEIKAEIRLVEAPTSEDVTNYIHTNTQPGEGGISYTYYWKDAACTETVLYREWVATPAVPDDPNTDENETKPEVKKYQVAKYVDDTTKPLKNEKGEALDVNGNVWVEGATPAYEKKLEWEAETTTDPKLQGDGVVTPKGTYAWSSNQEIMELPQNTAVQLSALVYLDGNTVTNADVSATGSKSLSGAMNLQFSSTANLTPMNYTPLQSTTGSNTNGGTATEYTVAMATDSKAGITLKDATAKAVDGQNFVFELTANEGATIAKVEYLVGEASATNVYKTLTVGADGKYTIPAAEVKGNITIKVS